jgi:hypothetical protein
MIKMKKMEFQDSEGNKIENISHIREEKYILYIVTKEGDVYMRELR